MSTLPDSPVSAGAASHQNWETDLGRQGSRSHWAKQLTNDQASVLKGEEGFSSFVITECPAFRIHVAFDMTMPFPVVLKTVLLVSWTWQ